MFYIHLFLKIINLKTKYKKRQNKKFRSGCHFPGSIFLRSVVLFRKSSFREGVDVYLRDREIVSEFSILRLPARLVSQIQIHNRWPLRLATLRGQSSQWVE